MVVGVILSSDENSQYHRASGLVPY